MSNTAGTIPTGAVPGGRFPVGVLVVVAVMVCLVAADDNSRLPGVRLWT